MTAYAGWRAPVTRVDDDLEFEFAESYVDDFLPRAPASA
jgi:hypothetical protein